MKTHVYPFHFAVEGSGEFPYDMLRYDSCFPATEWDSRSLGDGGTRRVRLRGYAPDKGQGPTAARWSSFRWRVVEDD